MQLQMNRAICAPHMLYAQINAFGAPNTVKFSLLKMVWCIHCNGMRHDQDHTHTHVTNITHHMHQNAIWINSNELLYSI